MKNTLTLRAGKNITVRGRPEDGDYAPEGLYFAKDGFDGWDDGPDVRTFQIVRPSNHGMFDLPSLLGGRPLSFTGLALAPSLGRLAFWKKVVTGLGASGLPVRFTVDHLEETLWADATIAATARFKDSGLRHGLMQAKFQWQFSAANPRKFGVAHLDGPATLVVAKNRGNFPASSLIEVTGSMPSGYTINGPVGRKYTVTQALTAGRKHLIDMANGRLYLDGVQQFGKTSARSVWAVPGGGNVPISISPVSGTGLLRVSTPATHV